MPSTVVMVRPLTSITSAVRWPSSPSWAPGQLNATPVHLTNDDSRVSFQSCSSATVESCRQPGTLGILTVVVGTTRPKSMPISGCASSSGCSFGSVPACRSSCM